VTGIVSGAWPLTLLIVGAIAVAAGSLAFHFGQKRIWAAIVALGVLLGIVVAVHELVATDGPAKPPASKSLPQGGFAATGAAHLGKLHERRPSPFRGVTAPYV
jgi:hypothetical protein